MIKCRPSQKIVSPIMRNPKSNWNPKYSKIRHSQPWSFENFGGGFIGCLKIIRDKSSDRALLQREGRILTKMWTSHPGANTDFKCRSEQICISFQMRVWATQCFTSNAGLSKFVFHLKYGSEQLRFKRGSEQLHILLSSNAGLSNFVSLFKRGSE